MRTNLDFAPLYRSSVGFDRVFALLENASRAQAADNWPPFDTVKLNDDAYQITMPWRASPKASWTSRCSRTC